MFVLCLVLGANKVDDVEQNLYNKLIGGIFVFSILVSLVGAVLGIVAVVKTGKDTSPQNSKTMAIVALVINCLYLLIVVILLALGAAASSH